MGVRPVSTRTVVITLLLSSTVSLLMMVSKSATVRVNGQRILSDVSPVSGVHEHFLPLRAVALGLGAVTSYDAKRGRIEIFRGRDTITMYLGERRAKLNGIDFQLEHAPFLVRGRVMVPSSLFMHALRSYVHYDASSETIDVLSNSHNASESEPNP